LNSELSRSAILLLFALDYLRILISFFAPVLVTMQSFIDVQKDSHFPIQNLPFGVFSTASKVRAYIKFIAN
jgi:hypothetical protein